MWNELGISGGTAINILGEFCGKRDIEEFTQNVLEKNWNQSG